MSSGLAAGGIRAVIVHDLLDVSTHDAPAFTRSASSEGHRRDPPAAHQVRLDQHPRRMAYRRDRSVAPRRVSPSRSSPHRYPPAACRSSSPRPGSTSMSYASGSASSSFNVSTFTASPQASLLQPLIFPPLMSCAGAITSVVAPAFSSASFGFSSSDLPKAFRRQNGHSLSP